LTARCSLGFQKAARAARDILKIASGDGARALRLAGYLTSSPDPAGALSHLTRFVQSRDLPPTDETLRVLALLFGHSPYLAEVLQVDPGALPEAMGSRRRPAPAAETYRAALRRALRGVSEDPRWRALRAFKDRRMAGIALRDFMKEWTLPEVTEQISFLADAILEESLDTVLREMTSVYGQPSGYDESGRRQRATAVILALGKLGGVELNYSSDVDLLFVYSHDGETRGLGKDPSTVIPNKEFFTRVAEAFTRRLTSSDGSGWILRVDWGLRPGGKDGDLTLPLSATAGYYRTWARPWERQALIKARSVAGDLELGRRLLHEVEDLVYPEEPQTGATDAIRDIKDRIDASLASRGTVAVDLKLGRGGIREIEFNVQGRQVLHAGRDPWLREANSLKAMHRLADKGHLSRGDHAVLTSAYQFLREAEHRIQIRRNLQRSTLPSGQGEMSVLARSMGYADPAPGRATEAFLADLEQHRTMVRALYDGFLASQSQKRLELEAAPDPFLDSLSDPEAKELLRAAGWPELETLLAGVRRIARHLSPPAVPVENRRAFRQVSPVILREIPSVASPARALRNLERLLESLSVDPAGMRAFLEEPERFGPILGLFGGSQPLSELLIHRPALLLDPAFLRALATDRSMAAHASALAARLQKCGSFAASLAALRHYQQAELLLIGLKDLSRQITIRAARRALSDLAEGSVRGAFKAAVARHQEQGHKVVRSFVVLALGRLGYREMDYGSDLDLVFIYQTARADPDLHTRAGLLATGVVEALDTITREGPLYAVDSRLRPFGGEGEIAQSAGTLLEYLKGPAGVWEMQSYLKARPVAGDLRAGERLLRKAEQAILDRAAREDLPGAVRSMRERLRAAASNPDDDLKSGRGGTHTVQFALHYLQLAHHVPSPPRKSTLRLLRSLRDLDLISEGAYTNLFRGERFLRRLEHQLRLIQGRSVTRMPDRADLLAEVARGLDYGGTQENAVAALTRDLGTHRAAIERAFDHVVPSPPSGSGRH
jgi:glutamate-ammonia-ligase adenylyltransferase